MRKITEEIMGEFILASDGHINDIKKFIDKHIDKCFFMQQGIYDFNGNVSKNLHEGFKYYEYIEDNSIEGLVFINKSNVMFPYFIGDEPYKKMDLLKIIKHHNPLIIRGEVKTVEKIFKVIERIMPLYGLKECVLMECKKETTDRNYGVSIISGSKINFNDAVEFLISAEREFSRNPLSVNQLKNRIVNGEGADYYFLMEEKTIASQGRIEYFAGNYGLVGGIYTRKNYRGKGYGEAISSYVTKIVKDMDKIPALIVEVDNENALGIYKKLGFEEIEKYRELILKKI